MEDENLRKKLMEDVVLLQLVGIHPVLVHGGGNEIDQLLKRLNLPIRKLKGRRVTSPETMEVVEMVLTGRVNKELVRLLQKSGARAVGISGKDGGLLLAEPREPELGLVGEIRSVCPEVLELLIQGGMIPVVAPIASSSQGETLNINADEAAAWIAVALKAEKLLLLTDVPGVRGAGGWIEAMGIRELRELLRAPEIEGGMIPKLECSLFALERGVQAVHILDGTVLHCLLLELFTDHGVGTMIEEGRALLYRNSEKS